MDYAPKHWGGLIRDYYANRVRAVQKQAVNDAAAGLPFNSTAADRALAMLAYRWTLSQKNYPVVGVGDAAQVSRALHHKYAPHFASCKA